MNTKMLDKFFKIVEKKFHINKTIPENTFPGNNYAEYLQHEIYLQGIIDEVQEVTQEIKKNNSVYLEDELGDIFWVYINLLYTLEKEGFISKEKVFKRAYKKFSERVEGLTNGVLWDEIKKIQKKKREQEHSKLYNL